MKKCVVESALIRNKYIIENSDEVVFGSLDANGMLNQLFAETKKVNKSHNTMIFMTKLEKLY